MLIPVKMPGRPEYSCPGPVHDGVINTDEITMVVRVDPMDLCRTDPVCLVHLSDGKAVHVLGRPTDFLPKEKT